MIQSAEKQPIVGDMNGMHTNSVHRLTQMVPWQESWELIFQEEKRLIADAMTAAGLNGNIYHTGSTSVKDMISKPIIDILLCPEKTAALDAFIPVLEQIGYTNLGECGRPGRFFLSKGNEENHTFYLHLCHEDHQVAIDQKLFQFIERNDPSVFYSYMRLKKALSVVFPLDRDEYRSVKGMYIDGVLNAYRLGERTLADKIMAEIGDEDDSRIKYWIYEFEMSEKARQEFDAVCALHELTPDEFMETALLDAIHRAKTDPEGYRKSCMEAQQAAGDDIRLVRYYPVYKGETEAQAYRRKLAEEAASKNGGKDPEAKDLSGI